MAPARPPGSGGHAPQRAMASGRVDGGSAQPRLTDRRPSRVLACPPRSSPIVERGGRGERPRRRPDGAHRAAVVGRVPFPQFTIGRCRWGGARDGAGWVLASVPVASSPPPPTPPSPPPSYTCRATCPLRRAWKSVDAAAFTRRRRIPSVGSSGRLARAVGLSCRRATTTGTSWAFWVWMGTGEGTNCVARQVPKTTSSRG